MEKTVRDNIVIAMASCLFAFLGASGGSALQGHIQNKQKLLEEKRAAYGKVLSKIGILPLNKDNKLKSVPWNPYGFKSLNGSKYPTFEDPLWNLPQEKYMEIQEALASAQLISGQALSEKISKLLTFIENKRRNENKILYLSKEDGPIIGKLLLENLFDLSIEFDEIKGLMRKEITD